MQPEERDAALLYDMLVAGQDILTFVKGKSYEEYMIDRVTRFAVERQLEIIGEAAKKVSIQLKEANPQIPWRNIIAQRNVLAHEYGSVDHDRIWEILVTHLPDLVEKLKPMIPPLPDESE